MLSFDNRHYIKHIHVGVFHNKGYIMRQRHTFFFFYKRVSLCQHILLASLLKHVNNVNHQPMCVCPFDLQIQVALY